MMRQFKLICFFMLLCLGSFAQLALRPDPPRLYNNLSQNHPDFLNAQEAAQMEEKLEQFSNATSNQICIVIVDSLNGYEPADYATKLINDWGIGKKGSNNGVVILLQLNADKGGRDFIAVGYGLEGAIPDLATKRIRDEELYPSLKAGQNFDALDKTTDKLMQLAKGEVNVKNYTRSGRRAPSGGVTALIIAIVIFIILRNMFGGGGGTTFSRRGRTYWGGFGGFGGGGFGGGSSGGGGGFGGFGGGSSGGGGSGGSW